jgi:hypothetical protein
MLTSYNVLCLTWALLGGVIVLFLGSRGVCRCRIHRVLAYGAGVIATVGILAGEGGWVMLALAGLYVWVGWFRDCECGRKPRRRRKLFIRRYSTAHR